MTEISLKDNIAPSFYEVDKALIDGDYTQFWLKGGRGSTKSSFTAIEIIVGIIEDPEANAIALRKVGDTIRTSIHANLVWAIHKLGVQDYFEWTTSPAEIVYKLTNQKIIMKGTDKPEKLKSIALVKGYFKYVWFEELAEYSGMEEIRNILQSTLRGGENFQVFMTYNPPDDEHNWVNKESLIENPDRYVHHSTYLDVPEDWLGQQFIRDAELLKKQNYDKYAHEYLGEVIGNTEKLVMSGRWKIGKEEEFENVHKLDGPYYGADWGFSKDPNVLCKLWVCWDTMHIYVEYAEYGYQTEIEEIPHLFSKVPDSRFNVIRGDNARPETINYVKRNGFPKMTAVKKWNGCVEEGVNYMQNFTWVFHPRCEKAIEEAKNWSFKVNTAGDVTSKLEEGFDHFWDSARYAITPLIKKNRSLSEEVIISVTTGGGDLGEVVI